MKIDIWDIERVTPYARNARKIPAIAIDKVASSIKEFGFRQPIVVDTDGVIIVGHTRLQAAQKLGFTTVPVHIADGLTPAQIKAYRLVDNRSNQESSWDDDLLVLEFGDLQLEGFGLSLTGFDADELDALLHDDNEGLCDPEEIPDVPKNPVSVPGDMWCLGNHRVRCGDSVSATDVQDLLGDVKPLLMVTDPPYGVEYEPEWRHKLGVNNSKRRGKVANDDKADWREAWALFPGDVAYVWHGGLHAGVVAESLIAADFKIRSQIIWAKPSLIIGRGDYHWQHEPCWYAVRSKGKGHWSGDRKQTTIWNIANRNQDTETVHGTQKPVECMKRPIENNSSPGQAVYDPFLGSGTTLIAAEMTGRMCLGMEIDPAYCDVIIERWQKFTGKDATHEETKETFNSRKAESGN